jgi:FlaA1/EpsC-like NDP-sugar epimerase
VTPPYRFRGERVLVTGAKGSIGKALLDVLGSYPEIASLTGTDRDEMDVRDDERVRDCFYSWQPTFVLHLAAAKSAPEGESDPESALLVNGVGTANVARACVEHGAKLVTASTCKAANPETAYGASKLIAERLTLNAGGWVARFYNVRESNGNVFETWRELEPDAPVPVTPCFRYFLSLDQAVLLLLAVPSFPPGRYTVNPGRASSMGEEASRLYPDRVHLSIPPRRGDRVAEPRHGTHERLVPMGSYGVERIEGWLDP